MDFFKTIEENILKNESLDIYEKMCLIVLFSQGETIELTSEELASYMGCGVNTAKRAFDSLRLKGFLSKDYAQVPPVRRESNVISPDADEVIEVSKTADLNVEAFQEGFFVGVPSENFVKGSQNLDLEDGEKTRRSLMAEYILGNDTVVADEPKKVFVSQKETKQDLVDQVIDLIDEKISFKEANIILGFAGNDIEKIKRHYRNAKRSQVSDTIGVLISTLQKRDSQVIKAEDTVVENRQINANRILKMQAYQKSRLDK